MAFWWKKTPKTASDYAKLLSEQLNKFENATTIDSRRKVQDDCSKYLTGTKHFLLGEVEPEPTPEAVDELYGAIYQLDILRDLLVNLPELEFEARKDVALIFATCLRHSRDNKFVTVDYLVTRPNVVALMLRTPELALSKPNSSDLFLKAGFIILEALKYEQLCRIMLRDPQIWLFFDFAKGGSFEVSTESFQILTNLFTIHQKPVATEFFSQPINLQKFIDKINKLMAHGNYVTKRQSVKLLHSLIMIRSYNHLLTAYINSPDNLKLIMILLSDRSKNLQLGSFNIFKVFVANPRKSKPILDIMVKNRDKLLHYLMSFNTDSKDATFLDEKEYVVQEIESLPRLVSPNSDPSLGTSP
ncbi:LANO_0G11452g1_1 [Lachancea nothofagi CBS 11611]|uniref:LANO_0G11452g1_1 n=1 Tax=Lachancea nothofagi CBS 11611 TaxID=1266666 RepID=A0A1G4KJA2_9SACH|nr:LANO_0G11452g1_1 [Lachancea nothofagi CBS 11611]